MLILIVLRFAQCYVNDGFGLFQDMKEKKLKKAGRGSSDYRVESKSNTISVRWYNRQAVNLVSSFAGEHPLDKVQDDRSLKAPVDVSRPNIVETEHKYMGGMM